MPNKVGLVSISFRKHSPDRILQAAAKADLQLIEWGGDVHVPHGDLQTADEIVARSAQYNMGIAEYGSYYVIGKSAHSGMAWYEYFGGSFDWKTISHGSNRRVAFFSATHKRTELSGDGSRCQAYL